LPSISFDLLLLARGLRCCSSERIPRACATVPSRYNIHIVISEDALARVPCLSVTWLMSHELRATSFHEGSTRLRSRATAYVNVYYYGVYTASAGSAGTPAPGVFQYTTSIGPHGRDTHAPRARAPEALRSATACDRRAVEGSTADRPYATLHLSTGRSRRTTRGPTRTAHRAWQMRHLTDTIMHRTCTGHACTRNYASMPDTTPDMRLQRARRHALPRDVHCPQYSPHASPGIIPEASRPAMVLGAMRPTRRPIASHPPKTSVTAPRPECATALRCGLGEMAQDFGGEMASRGFGGWARWRPRVMELLLC